MNRFENRSDAGKALAEKLTAYKDSNPVILAIHRGGLPVGYEIATALKCPLDILFLEKTADGEIRENPHIIKKLRAPGEVPTIKNQVVILVDEGVVTGTTMRTAIDFLKHKEPAKIIVAVPAIPQPSLGILQESGALIQNLETSENILGVGAWFKNFDPISDNDMIRYLREANFLHNHSSEPVVINDNDKELRGELIEFTDMKGLVIFAHGSGSSRLSPRNQYVAKEFNKAGFGTLLLDLLTEEEAVHRKNLFDIRLQARRLLLATEWSVQRLKNKKTPIAYFGADTGAGVALMAAGQNIHDIFAIVTRGGRPDLAGEFLNKINSPTLLIVGAKDTSNFSHNKEAHRLLPSSRLVVVPSATHLFEEPGALEEVVEYSLGWYLENKPSQSKNIEPQENVVHELLQRSHPIQDTHSWDGLIEKIADSRVVMLGEATHGTAEFYNIRRYLSERLIKDHDFRFIAVEGDWPSCELLNNYIQNGEGPDAISIMRHFSRWPTWMWANEETATLIEWMKNFKTGFHGLDIYSFFDSIEVVKGFIKGLDPQLARTIQKNYACLDPFAPDEKSYAQHLAKFPEGCRQEILANLQELLRIRLGEFADKDPALFNAQQNARIASHAEEYYRAMLQGGPESWNIRDHHMINTLELLMRHYGDDSKCIVWAHNSHIGDYHATDMLESGYVNLGGLARESFGADKVSLVGFTTFQGQVLASPAWDGPETVTDLPAAHESSLEYFCHKTAEDLVTKRFYVTFDAEARKSVLGRRSYGHRAVGVVYRSQFEDRGHNYVPSIPAKRYDALVFVDKTSALRSLHSPYNKLEFPETWPGGL